MTATEQARADALADAATLLAFVSVHCEARSAARRLSGLWLRALCVAGTRDARRARAQARGAARLAFRAVPGLRGGR